MSSPLSPSALSCFDPCSSPAMRQAGFTLTELAVVLAIVALLIGGLLMPLGAQLDNRSNQESQKVLGEIREALVGYAASHKAADGHPHLPCPDADNDGQENRTASACAANEGGIPWADLGLGQSDAWNNRFRYRVTPTFARNDVGFTLSSTGALRVCADSGCGALVASFIPAVILSHGKNGLGALNSNGGTNPASGDANEKENTDDDNDFVSRAPEPTFDDLVVWLSPNILYNRMIAAQRLP